MINLVGLKCQNHENILEYYGGTNGPNYGSLKSKYLL